MVGTIAIMNVASYFPEIVKARTSAGVLFSMINRKPATGDCRDGMKIVSEKFIPIRMSNLTFNFDFNWVFYLKLLLRIILVKRN